MQGEEPRGAESFAEFLDAAVRARGMSNAALRRRLGAIGIRVSDGALRAWRSGSRRPEHASSLDAVEGIEHVLGLGHGTLLSRLGPSRRLHRSPVASYDSLVGSPGVLEPLLLDGSEPDDLESIGGTVVVDVGRDRRIRAISNRMLWRARRDGARRTHIKMGVDSAMPHLPVARVVGADIRGSAHDPDAGLAVWFIEFPRPLRTGETTMIEWIIDGEVDTEEALYVEGVAERRTEEAGLWIRFDGDPPRHVESFEDSADGCTSRVVTPTGRSVEHHVRNFGPGVLGVRWEW